VPDLGRSRGSGPDRAHAPGRLTVAECNDYVTDRAFRTSESERTVARRRYCRPHLPTDSL